ncbi:hypothetical protein F383_37081 [Gossypium arboreum]|uniref:Uncharacterized protein n=1 Tax=Gossypium arboreum TaxID=29729 RepID=A0A0B0MG51_GOSAR|nr:hypothetical protein F383_37081 [Gossypium arboreum]
MLKIEVLKCCKLKC